MSRDQASEQGLMPSILDRLTDPAAVGNQGKWGYSIEQMVQAVQRDLEELLNTRQSHVGLPTDFKELHRSVYTFGLPDLTSLNTVSEQQREDVGRILEAVVVLFEPRLKDVRAAMLPAGDETNRTVQFRLEAKLNVDPAPEVAFDTILELTTGHYSVKPSDT